MRSLLFRRIMSAHRIWSSNTSSSGLSCSTAASAARCAASAVGIVGERARGHRRAVDDGDDAVDRHPGADRRPVEGLRPAASAGRGPRSRSGCARAASAGRAAFPAPARNRRRRCSTCSRSAARRCRPRVQPSMPQPSRNEPSKPRSPNSLTSTASRRPPAFSRRWRTSVVLPAPRKPVTTVQGILPRLASFGGVLDGARRGGGMRATTPLRNACGPLAPGHDAVGARA